MGEELETDMEGHKSSRFAIPEKQVEVGEVVERNLGWSVLLLAENWPSWLLALEGLGFEDINCYCQFQNLSSKLEFESTSLGVYLVPGSKVGSIIGECSNSKLILFIQGSQVFYNLVSNLYIFETFRYLSSPYITNGILELSIAECALDVEDEGDG